ncbi:restriction endonuclease [Thermomonas sp. HDW16]|uniref:restriction endonuclease n=1 Tax=Thermomonas sp. HDW16 TaxID=2714945 RepID=UPI001409AB0F|nr:restriction endonuclease [Thermomonas sp. HDW16]QIL20541.1 restriction endonuclease [Thermomonas sp. HDW16]
MFSFLIALIVFVLAGLAANVLLRKQPANSNELKLGLAHLAGLRWRDFAKLVLQAMHARGYQTVRDKDGPADGLPTDGGDILLRRDGQLTLLSCKYGNASVVGTQPILGLGKSAELRGADMAIVVTPGRFDEEAKRVAKRQHVELIDGATLWPEVKPFIDDDISHQAGLQTEKKNATIAWSGAAVLAAVTWMLVQGIQPPSTEAAVDGSVTATAARSAPATTASTTTAEQQAVPSDPAILERRRSETANAISTLPGVDRAVWSTQSTLLVYLASEAADPSSALCPLLERYPELAPSRVQLQPPQGSEKPVRFKQCRSY